MQRKHILQKDLNQTHTNEFQTILSTVATVLYTSIRKYGTSITVSQLLNEDWLSYGFTSHSTQNRSFWRRFPEPATEKN